MLEALYLYHPVLPVQRQAEMSWYPVQQLAQAVSVDLYRSLLDQHQLTPLGHCHWSVDQASEDLVEASLSRLDLATVDEVAPSI